MFPAISPWADPAALGQYWLDAAQRAVMMLDTLRRRGNTFVERAETEAPHVLSFPADLVCDGRRLPRPVNYVLVQIQTPAGVTPDPARRPVVVVDPRAGHGPGIGGMKQDSEIGMALAAGHPCYFVGFLTQPQPGQTIEDVCTAEAHFLRLVAERHPQADGKPMMICNCQAGWQVMMMAALNPDLPGPIMLAGTPLLYWAGVRGKNPLRYLGGVMGGTWATALAGDMGGGIFDGAHLVSNFESMNPANTYWSKAYRVWDKIDTEVDRFLDFETWWGSPVLLNAGEMQWIADNLFVGNRLSTGHIATSDGTRIDLRNIRSPIIVFCSWGDDITPPQQALHWVLDLYGSDREIIENGQTIVYTMHQSIGHLGIFVSGQVATKEHGEFVSCMDMIDVMPPGLYEAVITEVEPDTANPELIHGKYLFRLEGRTLDDIRALGGNDAEDDLRFATAARVSEINRGLYQTLAAPAVRAMVPEPVAEALRATHPSRLRFGMFSDRNPFMAPVKAWAEAARADRQAVPADNPWRVMEHRMSDAITGWLKAYGAARDMMTEAAFHTIYGSPLLQAAVGLAPGVAAPQTRIEHDLARQAAVARIRTELAGRYGTGGIAEALIRALVYVRLPDGAVDERGFSVLTALRAARPETERMPLAKFKELVRTQYLLVLLDEDRAVETLPALLGTDPAAPALLLSVLRRVLMASGRISPEAQARLGRLDSLLAAAEPVA